MRVTQVSRLIPFTLLVAISLTSNAQTSGPTPSANLASIAFFTAHEWEAQLPDAPDGKKRRIHAQFSLAKNGQAIRINNQMITDGKPSPYIEGLYAWDPQQRAIVFWYVGAEGSLSKGTVKSEAETLVHEFTEIGPDGKTNEYVARVTQTGDTGWQNEILLRGANGLTPVVKVRYQVAK